MMSSLRISLFVVLIAGLLVGCASPAATVAPAVTASLTAIPAPTMEPGDSERKVIVNEVERNYFLHVPPGLDKNRPVPVLFAFHGLGEEPSAMELLTGFNEVANQSHFIVVYPEGLGLSWNAGEICCRYALENNIDDIAFVRQILSDLETIASIDPKRIFATGWSNGASLSYRLACEMSDVFAAVGSVSGGLLYSPCQPPQPVSVIHVHGLMDTTVPYAGGQGDFLANVIFPPTEQAITTWVQLDSCTGSPQVEKEKIFTHTAYSSCKAGTAVELYTIEAGRHDWPSKYVWPASQVIWDFFAAHPKP